jgi:tetratricopeptide (TPR) repeat protein
VKFEKAYEMDDEDPEILNMLAFTMRKTGDLEGAFAFYEQALALRERFPQAREYLGEAHLQAALLQIQILAGYGAEGEAELAALLDALKRAANQAAGTDFEVDPASW